MAEQPQTVDEWHEAALSAAAFRLIHDAKLYGLIEGGPEINAERCDEIIAQAAAVGIVPELAEVQSAAVDLMTQLNADTPTNKQGELTR